MHENEVCYFFYKMLRKSHPCSKSQRAQLVKHFKINYKNLVIQVTKKITTVLAECLRSL